jgi:hypothetical protein
MTRVWEHSQQSGSKLLLMLALADHANDDSVCWPGIPRLAQKIRRTERQVKSILRSLENAGEVYIVLGGGRHNTNLYFVTVGLDETEIKRVAAERLQLPETKAQAIAESITGQKGEENFTIKKGEAQRQKGEVLSQKGEAQRQERVKPASPEPSLESSNNHHENHHNSANAQNKSLKVEKQTKQPTGKNALKAVLSESFSQIAQIPLPLTKTQRQCREASVKWWQPLLNISAACDDDIQDATILITWSVNKLDSEGFTVSSPKSIEKIAIAEQARRKREIAVKGKQAALLKSREQIQRERQTQEQAEKATMHPHLVQALDVWSLACEHLRVTLDREVYALNIEPLEVLQPNGVFRLQAPDSMAHERLEHRLRPAVERALELAKGRPVSIEFVQHEIPAGEG